MSVVIRSYRHDDLDDVLDVWYEASLIAHPFVSEEFLAAEREEIAEHWLPIAETIVFETEGRVVGFLALIGNEVGAVFVSPDHQRQGIGRALMDWAQASRPFLELDVFEANASGRGFYAAYGFEQVGRQVHAPTGQTELRLRLGASVAPDGPVETPTFAGLEDVDALEREQHRLAALAPPLWAPGSEAIVAGGVFVAFARGEQGPGRAGDRAHIGGAATRGTAELTQVVVVGRAGAPYAPGLLAAREGAMLEAAARALLATGIELDVLLVDATGRDHPRRAGLALHLGAVLDMPTVGVTHRPLLAVGPYPPEEQGASTELSVDDEVVGRWLRTRAGVRPVAVHAAWRTDDRTAVDVATRVTGEARTPEPLRLARTAAREARAREEGRGFSSRR